MEKPKDVIQSTVGSFGCWQALVCLVPYYTKFAVGFHQVSTIFLAAATNFTCVNIENATDHCQAGCNKWKYDTSVFDSTIISEWNLVCDYTPLAALQQTILMFGILVGNFIFGMLSDKYGRRRPFILANIIQLLSAVSTAISPAYWFYCITRFLTGFGTGGTMLIGFVISLEVVGVEWRELVTMLYQIPFSMGHASLSVFSYYLRSWREFQLAISLPTIISLLYIFGPESPRWLFATKNLEKTIQVLEKGAKINRRPIETIRPEITAYSRTFSAFNSDEPRENVTFIHLFTRRKIRTKTLCMSFNWFSAGFGYFGVASYAGSLGASLFLSVAITASIALPGSILALLMFKCLGRKYTLIISDAVSGVALLTIAFLPSTKPIILVCIAAIGLMAFMMSFATVYLYTSELFPTVLRNNAMGFCSMICRIGTMLAPLLALLAVYSEIIAPLVFGCVSLLAAVAVIFLPETKNTLLPQSVESSEAIG